MKKIILILTISFTFLNPLLGQIEKTELTKEEISTLGRLKHGSYSKNSFTEEEINEYNLKNTLAYLLEYEYDGKVLHRDVFGVSNFITSKELNFKINLRSLPCFELSSIPNELSFSLMKSNKWGTRKSVKGESICFKPLGMFNDGMKIFKTEDYKKYELINLEDDQIKLKLYKLTE